MCTCFFAHVCFHLRLVNLTCLITHKGYYVHNFSKRFPSLSISAWLYMILPVQKRREKLRRRFTTLRQNSNTNLPHAEPTLYTKNRMRNLNWAPEYGVLVSFLLFNILHA